MRIALYGGTFDPIHHGHLLLARDAIEQLQLDRVIFIPASLSPHKPGTRPAAGAMRREMIAAAIDGEPTFDLDDSELSREGPSFSADTAEGYRARFPEADIFYLIGHDNVAKLHTWRRIDDLQRAVQFVVFDRGNIAADHALPSLTRRVDISATEIRDRVARGLSIRYLVPESVHTLIEREQLYQEIPTH